MQNFLRYITYIITLTLFTSLSFNLLFSNLFLNSGNPERYLTNPSNIEIKDYSKSFHGSNARIVFFGNSTILHAIDSNHLSSLVKKETINLGIRAGNMENLFFILREHLNRNDSPEIIIIGISHFSLDENRLHNVFDNTMLFRIQDYGNSDISNKRKSEILNFKDDLLTLKLAYFDYKKVMGFSDRYLRDYSVQPFDSVVFFKNFVDGKSSNDPEQFSYFAKIKKLLLSSQSKIIFITTPEYEEYTAAHFEDLTVDRILNNMPKSVAYYNFTKGGNKYDPELRNLMLDSHHIGKRKDFTEILYKIFKAEGIFP